MHRALVPLMSALVAAACARPPSPAPVRPGDRADDNAARGSSAVAVTDATLSLLVPVGPACVWQRRDPLADRSEEIARFPGDCFGARVAWQPDLSHALVWFDPDTHHGATWSGQGAPKPGFPDEEARGAARIFLVELASHQVRALPLPALADPVEEIALGPDGAPLAFSTHDFPDLRGGVVSFEGTTLDFSDLSEGMPAAALAHRLDGSTWTLVEVARTTTGWDYAAGFEAASRAETLGPGSAALLDPRLGGDVIGDPALRGALAGLHAGPVVEGDGWMAFGGGGEREPLYAWQITGEFSYPTGLIAWRGATGAVELLPGLGFTGGDLVVLARQGDYVLVSSPRAGSHPRLYDLASHRLVFTSDAARAATFWPAFAAGTAGD